MSKIYSEDFRRCVVDNIRNGMKWNEAIKIFKISRNSISNWLKLEEATGSLKGKCRGFYKPRKIDKDVLENKISECPDSTLKELSEHFNCCHQAVHKMCVKLSITRKKNHVIRGERRRKKTRIHSGD